jgi:hypothetical protein
MGFKTIAAMLIPALLATSCHSVRHYAVRVDLDDMKDSNSCYRDCQFARAGRADAYLSCVRACPDVAVSDGDECPEFPQYSDRVCIDERVSRVSAGKTVLLVLLLVGGAVLLTGAAAR